MENSSTTNQPDTNTLLLKLLQEQKLTKELIIEEGTKNKTEIIDNTDVVKNEIQLQFDTLKKQNITLYDKLDEIKEHNILLKEELSNNTSDKILKILGASFIIFFSISILFTVFLNFELVKFNWAKLGFLISLAIIAIGYFVGKMFKQELNDR